MKNEEIIGVRIPRELRGHIERERKRISRVAGAEVKMSAVIRAVLVRAFTPKTQRKVATGFRASAAGG